MVIMSIGLLILLAGFSEGARARASAALYSKAVILTEGLLDQKLAEGDLSEGSSEGDWPEDTRYRWRMVARDFAAGRSEAKEERRFLEVELITEWRDGSQERSFGLRTVVPREEE